MARHRGKGCHFLILEEACHTSTEATAAILPSDERRRLSMCCQRCYSAKYEVFERVGTPHNWMVSGKSVVLFEDFVFSGIATPFTDSSTVHKSPEAGLAIAPCPIMPA